MRPATCITTDTLDLRRIDREFSRADLEFHGVGHATVSYSARVFLGNPGADAETPLTDDAGYAGTFNIFGHGGCFGGDGHCSIRTRRAFDPRREHPLVGIRKVLIATEAIRRAAAAGDDVVVTVVPLVTGETDQTDDSPDVVHFDQVQLITYR